MNFENSYHIDMNMSGRRFAGFDNVMSNNITMTTTASQGPLAPLTIVPVSIDQHHSSSASMWSPFSTPSFSPYSHSGKATFQYSNPLFSPNYVSVHSPSTMSPGCLRPISKSCLKTNTNLPLTNTLNARRHHYDGHLGSPRSIKSSQVSYSKVGANRENQAPFDDLASSKMPKRSDQVDMTKYIEEAAALRAQGHRLKACTFCKSNGEVE
jgi:hypothetical protein